MKWSCSNSEDLIEYVPHSCDNMVLFRCRICMAFQPQDSFCEVQPHRASLNVKSINFAPVSFDY